MADEAHYRSAVIETFLVPTAFKLASHASIPIPLQGLSQSAPECLCLLNSGSYVLDRLAQTGQHIDQLPLDFVYAAMHLTADLFSS